MSSKKTDNGFLVTRSSFDTSRLREGLQAFLDIVPIDDNDNPLLTRVAKSRSKKRGDRVEGLPIGAYRRGVYAFYDYEKSPIYVGQTREMVSTRIRRHLTNQRTDAVAMSVLDPFEVCFVSVWPLPSLQEVDGRSQTVVTGLNSLEHSVFEQLRGKGKYPILLNEKDPPSSDSVLIGNPIFGKILPDSLIEVRGHPDVRIARRALTISRLAQVISERELRGTGLRRALVVQAMRLQLLAESRFADTGGQAQVIERGANDGEDDKGE